jgi:hypothetical protein
MLYLEDKQQQRKRISDRQDSLSTLRIIARTPNNADTLARNIPSGPVIYLPANCGDNEDQTMDSPMFKQPENDVIVRFNSEGQIEVIIGRLLTKEQTRLFYNGARSFSFMSVDPRPISSTIPGDHCGFTFTLLPWEAKNAQAHRETIARYAREFVAGLLPEAKQVSLFDICEKPAATQTSLF